MKNLFQHEWVKAAGLFGLVWLPCTLFLAASGDNFLFPVSSLLLFGIILTAASVFLTRKADAPRVEVHRPKSETLALLAYLVVYALLLFGPVSGWLRAAVPEGRAEALAMLGYKLITHLFIPALLIRMVGGNLKGVFDGGLHRRGVKMTLVLMSGLAIVVVGLLNSTFDALAKGGASPTAIALWVAFAWLWLSIEAGLCEEFLFRGLLQSRLTAWLGSPPMAIVIGAMVFALVHVPAFYLRGGDAVAQQASGLPQLIALAIGALAPIAILFGTLWHRTRSLLLVAIVHGAFDALPATEKMMHLWG